MADAGELRQLNTDAVRRCLQAGSTMSKNQLARQTGLSFPTVSRTVDALVEQGVVLAQGVDNTTGGRNAQLYAINPTHTVTLSLRLEAGHLRWFISDLAGHTLAEDEVRCESGALQALEAMLKQTRASYPQLGAVAMGIDGTVNDGVVIETFGHTELRGIDLRQFVQGLVGVPVQVENDMSMAAAGYYARCADPPKAAVCIYLGSCGIGSGIVLNGSVWYGVTGYAGEIHWLPLRGTMPLHGNAGEDAAEYYAQLICAYAAVLNPSRVVLYENSFIRGQLDDIRRRCAGVLPAAAIPQIEISTGFGADYEAGLIALAQKLLDSSTPTAEGDML